jgi:hypothetical protein
MNWLEENAPTASIRRAVGEGSVEFLGWFSVLEGSRYPGWIVKITSTITNIVWYTVIRTTVCDRYYHTWVLFGDPPWQYYDPKNSENPFMQGDNPEIYRQNREDTQADRRSEIHQEDISA